MCAMGLSQQAGEAAVAKELGELEVGGCLGGQRTVFGDGIAQAADDEVLIVGAGTEHGFQVAGVGIGMLHGIEGVLGFVVVLGQNLCQGGTVGLGIAEGVQSAVVLALWSLLCILPELQKQNHPANQ